MNQARKDRGITGGAPSKITPQLLARAKQFVDGGWRKHNQAIPTVEGLAKHLGLWRTALYDIPELADTLECIQRDQANALVEKGLMNEYNPAIVKLLLSSKHGYVERSEVANTHSMTAQPQQAIAQDFSDYVKGKTQAIDSTATVQTDTTEQA